MYGLTDHFCGAGGSTEGASEVDGVEVQVAANHWDLAIETHAANHPETDHIRADLNLISPAYFPATELAWFSPDCTDHSQAKGVTADQMADELWGESLPEEAAARSRATMWDVVRFTEHHRYLAVIVENVIEIAKWGPNRNGQIFRNWLTRMVNLGYRYEIVCLNSMHASTEGAPAPQSRDRIYIVFWQEGNPVPDLESVRRPGAMCTDCDLIVAAVQSWKRKGNLVGRYRQQYVYRCPNCSGIVEPYWVPASSIIDWDLLGQRIGDREKPLADKTRMRIAAGMARYWGPLMLQHGGHQYDAADPKHRNHGQGHGYYRVRPVTDPIPVVDTVVSKALAVPVEGREGKKAKPVEEPLRTQTARLETGLAFVAHLKGTSESQIKGAHSPVSEPLHTVAASGNHHGLVTPYYGNSHGAKSTDDPVGTITGTDRWGLVMRNNGSKGSGAEMTTPATEPIRTLTTTGHQSVVTADDIKAALEAVDEVRFRMLEPSECKRAMAFRPDYIMKGTRRSQVRLAGQAVTPPVARDLVWAVVRSLEGVK